MFAKVTVCLQSGCIWPPSLRLGPEVSSYYIRVHTFDDLFHFASFHFVSFRSGFYCITSRGVLVVSINLPFFFGTNLLSQNTVLTFRDLYILTQIGFLSNLMASGTA